MLSKNDLKLIGSFIDSKNMKECLNYCLVNEKGIFATDTKKAISFNCTGAKNSGLVHKKMLKGLETCLGKDDTIALKGDYFVNSTVKMNINGSETVKNDHFVNIDRIIDMALINHFVLEDISDLQFELAQRNCYIDDILLNPVISFNECDYFDIFYKEQVQEGSNINAGTVKIIGQKDIDETREVVFTVVLLGRAFLSQIEE